MNSPNSIKLSKSTSINVWYYSFSSRLSQIREELKSRFESEKILWDPIWDDLFKRGDILRAAMMGEHFDLAVRQRVYVIQECLNAILQENPHKRIESVYILGNNFVSVRFKDWSEAIVGADYQIRYRRVRYRRVTEKDKEATLKDSSK